MLSPSPLTTQACEDRDFAEWHGGCPWCAVWLLRADLPAVEAALQQARAALAPWMLPRYARQPHVTLAYRGLMAGDQAHARSEFGAAQLQRDVQALQAAALAPFALQLQGWGSFTTVPYLAVTPQPVLQQTHAVLMAQTPYPDWQYVPHVTLGHYACALPVPTVLETLEAKVGPLAVMLPVTALWLARYRTHDIAGTLSFEGCFDLHTQRYQAAPGALLPLTSQALRPGSG